MKTITLDDRLLRGSIETTKREFKPLIRNLEIQLSDMFEEKKFEKIIKVANKTINTYGGIYNSLKEIVPRKEDDKEYRNYLIYATSDATNQVMNYEEEINFTPTINLETNNTDKVTLMETIEIIYQEMINCQTDYNYKQQTFSKKIGKKIKEIEINAQENIIDEEYKELTIINENFKINLKEKNQNKKGLNRSHQQKKLETIIIDPIKKEEIIGNKEGIKILEREINCLLHYNPLTEKNFFEGFQQYILLAGKKGTGKTMLGKYGITHAKEASQKNNLKLEVVRLDFEDRWQYGPLENIRKQFTEISKGEKNYIIFIDELDTKIPSRINGEHKEIVGEFLRFRGGDYTNKWNYMMIATTNDPTSIDPAITNVFKTINIPGPITSKEKTEILYKNLEEGIKKGYIKINDWGKIERMLEQHELGGRDIVNISKEAKNNYRRIAERIPLKIKNEEKERIIREIVLKDPKYQTTEEDIYQSIIKQKEKERILKEKYI
jgi:SpoVK/Ycf46/Vps4 family AAA+-type ATPase